MPGILIAGSRGIPAQYGGFETFVQEIVPYLSEHYSPIVITGFTANPEFNSPQIYEVQKNIFVIRVAARGWHRLQNLRCTFISARLARKKFKIDDALVLNDVNFLSALYLKLNGIRVVIHLDGDEVVRRGIPRLGRMLHKFFRLLSLKFIDICVVDAQALYQDINPKYRGKVQIIKYGATRDFSDRSLITDLVGLNENYLIAIARTVPENNLLEIIQSHLNSTTDLKLHIIGLGTGNQRHETHLRNFANSSQLIKLHSALYDSKLINALLRHSSGYIHGHEAGGTNPILVSARQHAPIIFANDNRFNREASTQKEYFWKNSEDLTSLLNNQSDLTNDLKPNCELQPGWDEIAASIKRLFITNSVKASNE